MKIKLSANSFVRLIDDGTIGYITNQLTKHDRTYNETGADFLAQLTRQPQSVDEIVDRLCSLYVKGDHRIIQHDFMNFANDLAENHFVVMGEDDENLDAKDLRFNYNQGNFKGLTSITKQPTVQITNGPAQEFLSVHDLQRPRIVSIEFELTSRCNERCIHCYIPNGKKNAGIDMPFNAFKYIIDQFVDMGGLHVTLSGGEALLHHDIARILRYCREKDLEISLLTNLALLNDGLIPILQEVNLSLIQVSLYSMNPATHDFITTVKGSFEKTKAAIEKLHAANVPLQISCPTMKANKNDYRDVMKYAQSLNVKAMTDYMIMAEANRDTSNLANRLSVEETGEVIKDIIEVDKDYKSMMHEEKPISSMREDKLAKNSVCGAGINDLCITANGDVYPCAGWQEMVCGNAFREPLKDIWENSPALNKVRRVTWKDFPKCMKCDARDYCNLCMVRNYNENGDMFKISDHFCKVAHLNKRLVEETIGN